MVMIYKLSPQPPWNTAVAKGVYEGAPVDHADGFIHFSTAQQAQFTAMKHFKGESDLVLVAVESDNLGDALKWEPSRGGDLFPHLYAPLRIDQVVWVKPLPLGADGHHQFPTMD